MNESQKHSKVEMEILSHEKEMMRAAMIKKLKDQPLAERIAFVKQNPDKKEWTVEEMKEELSNLGLGENVTEEQIAEVMKQGK